jgi:hypothetical protein
MGGSYQRHHLVPGFHIILAGMQQHSFDRRADVNLHGFILNISRDFRFRLQFNILIGLYRAYYHPIDNCMGSQTCLNDPGRLKQRAASMLAITFPLMWPSTRRPPLKAIQRVDLALELAVFSEHRPRDVHELVCVSLFAPCRSNTFIWTLDNGFWADKLFHALIELEAYVKTGGAFTGQGYHHLLAIFRN